MGNHSYKAAPTGWAGLQDECATLRRLVNATSANLAEMDRLLERAEQLVARGVRTSVPSYGDERRWTPALAA